VDHDPLDDVDPRLTNQLGDLGDEFGQLGVLLVAASMWPDAFLALTARLDLPPTQPTESPSPSPAPTG
jgi:hypothetical protein